MRRRWRPLDGGMGAQLDLQGAAQRIIDESGGQPPVELVNRLDPRPILEKSLPPDQMDALIAEGRRLTDDQAMTLALALAPAEQAMTLAKD